MCFRQEKYIYFLTIRFAFPKISEGQHQVADIEREGRVFLLAGTEGFVFYFEGREAEKRTYGHFFRTQRSIFFASIKN